jgi:hypothetical protein
MNQRQNIMSQKKWQPLLTIVHPKDLGRIWLKMDKLKAMRELECSQSPLWPLPRLRDKLPLNRIWN